MPKTTLFVLFLAAITAPLPARGSEIPQAPPQITVLLYNYAGASGQTLSLAQQQASRLLLATGVRLRWLSCTLNEQGVPQDPLCNRAQGPATVAMLICPRQMAPKQGLPRGIFGFSLISENGTSKSARIYLHRLEELADGPELRKGPLLGSMMAHEIGHLLLGANSHARRGIMSIPWDSEKLRKADLGQLAFTNKEAAAIRTEALRRIAQESKPSTR